MARSVRAILVWIPTEVNLISGALMQGMNYYKEIKHNTEQTVNSLCLNFIFGNRIETLHRFETLYFQIQEPMARLLVGLVSVLFASM